MELPLRPGTALDDRLRIVLARDGSRVEASVNDRDNKPIEDAFVYLIPTAVKSEIELAAKLISGQTGGDGIFQTRAIHPGKYLVLATLESVSAAPERIALLWNARLRGKEIDLQPGNLAQMKLELAPLK